MQHSLSLPEHKKIILFDGVCNLCNSAVQTIIQQHIGVDTRKIDSLVFYAPGVSYSYKSEAVLDIAKELGGIFSLAIAFKILPTPLLNSIYDYVAKNRYKWYGQQEHCLMATPELKAKFL